MPEDSEKFELKIEDGEEGKEEKEEEIKEEKEAEIETAEEKIIGKEEGKEEQEVEIETKEELEEARREIEEATGEEKELKEEELKEGKIEEKSPEEEIKEEKISKEEEVLGERGKIEKIEEAAEKEEKLSKEDLELLKEAPTYIQAKIPTGSTYRGYTQDESGRVEPGIMFYLNGYEEKWEEKEKGFIPPKNLVIQTGKFKESGESYLYLQYRLDTSGFREWRETFNRIRIILPGEKAERIFSILKEDPNYFKGFLEKVDPELIKLSPPYEKMIDKALFRKKKEGEIIFEEEEIKLRKGEEKPLEEKVEEKKIKEEKIIESAKESKEKLTALKELEEKQEELLKERKELDSEYREITGGIGFKIRRVLGSENPRLNEINERRSEIQGKLVEIHYKIKELREER